MERLVKRNLPPQFKPFMLNLYISQQNRKFGLYADDIYNACSTFGIDWIAMCALACQRTKWFSEVSPGKNMFGLKLLGSPEEQIAMMPKEVTELSTLDDLLPTEDERSIHDKLYKKMTNFCISMSDETPKPLPVPDVPAPPPAPLPPTPPAKDDHSTTPVPIPKAGPSGPSWKSTLVSLLTVLVTCLAVASFFVPALAPVAAIVKSILAALQSIF